MVLSFNEIGAYLGMKGSAVSQLSKGETIKGDKELGRIVGKIKEEGLLNVNGLLLKSPIQKYLKI